MAQAASAFSSGKLLNGKYNNGASKERFEEVGGNKLNTPGPGSYFIPSKTDVNIVEFKYNPKYQGLLVENFLYFRIRSAFW